MEKISIIVPCYNEEKAVPLFYDEMERVIKEDFSKSNLKFEYIFVNDGSLCLPGADEGGEILHL